jgi:hypothetical protein
MLIHIIGAGMLTQSDANIAVSLQNSTTYILSFDITPVDEGGSAYMRIYDDQNINIYKAFAYYGVGAHQIIFTTPATSNPGGIRFYVSTTGDAFSIDNISLIQGEEPAGSPYFISLTGHDGNDGSIDSPFATPERAFSVAEAGDSIYIRAGTYYRTQNQGTMAVSVPSGSIAQGSAGNIIFFGGYPPDIANGDSVIFDFINVAPTEPDYEGIEADPPTANTVYNTGFSFSWVNYLHLENFTVRNVLQRYRYVQARGINFYATNYIRLERVNVHYIGGQGIYNANGTIDPTKYQIDGDTLVADPPLDAYTITDSTVWLRGDSTYVINCDGIHCLDSFAINVANYKQGQAGSWAQAFFFTFSYPEDYMEFNGCRAWKCGDDGYNLVGNGEKRTKNCWSFNNGVYLPYLDYTTPGQGFKLNFAPHLEIIEPYPDLISHYVTNCISAYNAGSGYSENSNGIARINRKMYNNITYKDESGFSTQTPTDPWDIPRDNTYYNNISYASTNPQLINNMGTNITNNWNDPPGVTVTDADFLALPTDAAHNLAILSAPRKADGSLPDIGDYYKLAPGSGLIGAGTDVGMSAVPDLGVDWDYYDATYGSGEDPPTPPSPSATGRGKSLRSEGKTYMYEGKRMIISTD